MGVNDRTYEILTHLGTTYSFLDVRTEFLRIAGFHWPLMLKLRHFQSCTGNVLKPGDIVLGYDLNNCNLGESFERPNVRNIFIGFVVVCMLLMVWLSLSLLQDSNLPDVVLVRKTFPNRKNRSTRRMFPSSCLNWVLDLIFACFLESCCAHPFCVPLGFTGKWKLKSMAKDASDKAPKKSEMLQDEQDMEQFMQVWGFDTLFP